MSDINSGASNEPSVYKRRTSDREADSGGIRTGGRRKSDRPQTLPKSKAAKIAIACSFFFSTGLVAWAFTLPFRSGGMTDEANPRNLPQAELANLEYEAKLSSLAYVNYTRTMDRRLMDRVQDKYETDRNVPTDLEVRQKWEQRLKIHKKQLQEMRESLDGKPPLKGTIEWENQKDLEKVINDAPVQT